MIIIPENLALKSPTQAQLALMDIDLGEKILYEKKSDFHKIYMVKNNIGKFIKFNDTYQAGYIKSKTYEGNLPYINYFFIPYLMNEKIKDILLIGFGSGILANQFNKIFSIKSFDIVDIEENIFPLAQKYFNFKPSSKMNFYLQDAIVYLKTINKKYDLIITDVAGDIGIDDRFCSIEYLELIKSHLKKDGIFVSNMPSSRDIFNKKNKFILNLLDDYRNTFENIDIYNGETSNKVFYKTFFDVDEILLDITNLILISSDKKYSINNSCIDKLGIDLKDYLNDYTT